MYLSHVISSLLSVRIQQRTRLECPSNLYWTIIKMLNSPNIPCLHTFDSVLCISWFFSLGMFMKLCEDWKFYFTFPCTSGHLFSPIRAMSSSLNRFPFCIYFYLCLNMFSIYLCVTHPNKNENEFTSINLSLLIKSAIENTIISEAEIDYFLKKKRWNE